MSGGSINYIYSKLDDAIDTVKGRASKPLHRAFAVHLEKVSKALHDLEWEWSCDTGEGDSDAAILAVLGPDAELQTVLAEAKEVSAQLSRLIAAKERA